MARMSRPGLSGSLPDASMADVASAVRSAMRVMRRQWSRRESNPRPPRCERGALPAELLPRMARTARGPGYIGAPGTRQPTMGHGGVADAGGRSGCQAGVHPPLCIQRAGALSGSRRRSAASRARRSAVSRLVAPAVSAGCSVGVAARAAAATSATTTSIDEIRMRARVARSVPRSLCRLWATDNPRAMEAVASHAVEYTCPMHPDVVQMGPGVCPLCGMALEPREPVLAAEEPVDPELADMWRRFVVAALLTLPVFVLSMAEMLLGGGRTAAWIQLALATPVVLWAGAPFFARGWTSIVTRRPNMFTLIALGTGVAWAYSVVATLAPGIFPAAARSHGGMV